ncbi:hypothetical protein A5685_12350 [Mycobacterium colombiense]|uniref:Uncharacterized protein n=1 Tax=Mycobacterium colombiense TaxID=339268 RepID=A0A1A2RRI8_9MYCO|nr:hypothetical protein [Mycobacterium colombiense]OBH54340.1 hypothetical protein A5685_12350 [Mycobacterium colombiense]
MAAEPLDEPNLTARLRNAKADYEARWKLIDGELYALCRRLRHDDFDEVFAKVAIVGRVYAAGVTRSWRGEGDPETGTARALIEQASLVQDGLRRLEDRPLDQQTAGEIVQLHAAVTRAISRLSVRFLTSFVSKYLHFHSPLVPIFDSRADAAIGKLVGGKRVRDVRNALPEGVGAYRKFLAGFVTLHERAYAETTLEPSVKELDHLLWRLS